MSLVSVFAAEAWERGDTNLKRKRGEHGRRFRFHGASSSGTAAGKEPRITRRRVWSRKASVQR